MKRTQKIKKTSIKVFKEVLSKKVGLPIENKNEEYDLDSVYMLDGSIKGKIRIGNNENYP